MFPVDEPIKQLAIAIASAGGRSLIVGGFVRDGLLGIASKDYDLEVYGLTLDALEAVLDRQGPVVRVGRAFGVLRLKGIDADISLPRRDNKTGRGHRGFAVELDPELDFAEAGRRRDLTVNSIGYDPLSGEVLDPHGGREDLVARRLRATDARHFSEDPLRGLRVAQFAARFRMEPDEELIALCRALDLSELPGERLFEEFRKLLLKGVTPSVGLRVLERTELIRFFPELAAMLGVPQDPRWHPEGDVWQHTLLVVDRAAEGRSGDERDDLALMFAALCHDVGKALVTEGDGERVHAYQHETAGLAPTDDLLARLRAPTELRTRVAGLVRHHLTPVQLIEDRASDKAFRRLARKLADARIDAELLVRLSRADQLGRGGRDSDDFPAGERFLQRMRALKIDRVAPVDVVKGQHLIARGMKPSPEFGRIIRRCREVQDETGWTDAGQILDRVLDSKT